MAVPMKSGGGGSAEMKLLAIDAICAIAYAEDIYVPRLSHDGNSAGLYTTKILSTRGNRTVCTGRFPEDKELSPLRQKSMSSPRCTIDPK